MSFKSGTIMQNSTLSFNLIQTFFLICATKKGFSSIEIQKQFGLKDICQSKRWFINCIRWAIEMFVTEGMIEFDEKCFKIVLEENRMRLSWQNLPH